jgi:hypothetical protein
MLGDTHIHAGIPTHATQDTSWGRLWWRTGLSPSKVSHSRLFSLHRLLSCWRPYTTCPCKQGFSFDCYAFDRLYWRNLNWFLFLPLLRCFTSGGSLSWRIYSCEYGGPIRGPAVHRFLASSRRFSQLGTPFVGSQTEPSTNWRKNQTFLLVLSL